MPPQPAAHRLQSLLVLSAALALFALFGTHTGRTQAVLPEGALWSFGAWPWLPWLLAGLAVAAWVGIGRRELPLHPTPAPTLRGDLAWGLFAWTLFWWGGDRSMSGDFPRIVTDVTRGVWLLKAEPLTPTLFQLGSVGTRAGLSLAVALQGFVSLVGALGIVVLRRLVAAHIPDAATAAFVFAAIASCGAVGLMFGHVEAYTAPTVVLLAALHQITAPELTRRRLFMGLALWTLACAIHMQMLCTGGALLIAYIRGLRTRAITWPWFIAGGVLSVATLVAVLVACILWPPPYPQYFGGIDGRLFVAPAERWAPQHLWAVSNVALLCYPGALAAAPALRRVPTMLWPWLAAAAGWMLFAFYWNPDLGAWHDWDLFAASGFLWSGLVALALGLTLHRTDAHRALVLMTLVNLARTAPFVRDNHG